METTSTKKVDSVALEQKVKKMYSDVALNPTGDYHFEMGLSLAEKLGYKKNDLDRIPAASIESFAGVGYYFDMADLIEGDLVLDLGSGSGMDSFIAAVKVGEKRNLIIGTNRGGYEESGLYYFPDKERKI